MSVNLKQFVERIFSINSSGSTVHGSSIGIGSRAITPGDTTSELINKLRGDTAVFAELLVKNRKPLPEIDEKAKAIEGYLMTLQALGQISPQFCDSLLSDLREVEQA
jgi:hypothetical protein